MGNEARSHRWAVVLLCAALLATGCAAQGTLVQDGELHGRPHAVSRPAPRDFSSGFIEAERPPRRQIVRTVASTGVQWDAFEQLLVSAGLETRDAWPVRGSALTPTMAARLLAVLMQKPVTLSNFPSRLGASYLLREVMEGGEVSREALLRRVERFKRVVLVMERVAVPVGVMATAVGTGVGSVYVLSTTSEGGPKVGSSGGPGAGKRFSDPIKDMEEGRAGGKCVLCGKETTRTPGPAQRNTDHAVPKSRGGNNTLDNAQNTCRTCNLRKGARTTDEYLQGEE